MNKEQADEIERLWMAVVEARRARITAGDLLKAKIEQLRRTLDSSQTTR